MVDLQQALGDVIRRERREQGLTMVQLAERAALSTVYLNEIELGKKYPSALVLERLAEGLGLQTADLLELLAAALRDAAEPVVTLAIGFALPGGSSRSPRMEVTRLAHTLDSQEVTMMAELGAFFLSRRERDDAE